MIQAFSNQTSKRLQQPAVVVAEQLGESLALEESFFHVTEIFSNFYVEFLIAFFRLKYLIPLTLYYKLLHFTMHKVIIYKVTD